MHIHQMKPVHSLKDKRRIGRGGKRGTYSGKGQKGQKSRAGAKIRSELREAILKIPKKRGIKFKNSPKKIKPAIVVVSLQVLERTFKNGDAVNLKILLSRGLIKAASGRVPAVKILAGSGSFSKKIYLSTLEVSQRAKELIEKAGGKVRV